MKVYLAGNNAGDDNMSEERKKARRRLTYYELIGNSSHSKSVLNNIINIQPPSRSFTGTKAAENAIS